MSAPRGATSPESPSPAVERAGSPPDADAAWSDFVAVVENRLPFADLRERFDRDALPGLTDRIFDALDDLLAAASDRDVAFVPRDPTPEDADAEGWMVGHVVTHLTAILEESAAHAATLARGVPVTGPSRFEVPWQTVSSVAAVRTRLAESRRMCQAFLAAWPDEPHLDLTMVQVPRFGPMDAVGRHVLGIVHAAVHLAHIRDILRQARA